MRSKILTVSAAVLALGMTAACGGGSGSSDAATATGPIKVWLSNNPEEIAWGKAMVQEWNSAHPKEKVTAQEIPAGKTSEEVIGAAITAGNAPCLVFNTSPAAVPQFQKQGGLVSLDEFSGAKDYIEARSGSAADQYQSPDGKFYQIPWKQNPVMIFYNKDLLKKAGVDPENPPLSTYDDFLATSDKIVTSKAAQAAIWPAPSSEFFQSWFDFYPAFAAETGGTPLIKDGKPQFDTAAGDKVADFWRTFYQEKLAPQEAYPGDALADGKAAMATVGPWAIAAYKDKIDWGVAPVPTSDGRPASQVHTFSDQKSIGMFSACKNRATAWDVMKFATSTQEDGAFLTATGQMPVREHLATQFAGWFAKNPAYLPFADQASREVEVPNVAGSIDIWQAFRDAWTRSVVFGRQSPSSALHDAAAKTSKILGEY
jgi:multiple sugar transport system substrate-binding protein